MEEEQKKQIAVFRFGAIADLVGGGQPGTRGTGTVDSGEVPTAVGDPLFGAQPVDPDDY